MRATSKTIIYSKDQLFAQDLFFGFATFPNPLQPQGIAYHGNGAQSHGGGAFDFIFHQVLISVI